MTILIPGMNLDRERIELKPRAVSPVFIVTVIITGGQSNLTKRLHCRHTWTVQSCSPGGANVHSHLICARHLGHSAIFAQLTAESPYTLQWAALFHSSKLLLCIGYLDFHLIHGFVGPPKSTSQTTSQLVHRFLQG